MYVYIYPALDLRQNGTTNFQKRKKMMIKFKIMNLGNGNTTDNAQYYNKPIQNTNSKA